MTVVYTVHSAQYTVGFHRGSCQETQDQWLNAGARHHHCHWGGGGGGHYSAMYDLWEVQRLGLH